MVGVFFSQRVINEWNSLSESQSVVKAELLLLFSTPGRTGLLTPREGRRPSIKQGRHRCRVRPEGIRVQSGREVRAVKKVKSVMLCHPAQGAIWGRMIGRIDVVQVGEKERGLVCSELC